MINSEFILFGMKVEQIYSLLIIIAKHCQLMIYIHCI